MNIVNKLQQILNQFLHNPVCWSCGLGHKGDLLICAECHFNIQRVIEPCLQCGLSHAGEGNVCVQCLSHPKLWQQMVAPLSYKPPVRQLIQQLKYNQKLEVLKALVELELPRYQAIFPKPDLLVPVPLHQNRYIERGFNQSLEITVLLSKTLNIPYSDNLVERVVDTSRQSGLKLKQREKNIKNAFLVNDDIRVFNHVVIVDDVITSGSTVNELVKTCWRKGVKRIDVWALARTELDK